MKKDKIKIRKSAPSLECLKLYINIIQEEQIVKRGQRQSKNIEISAIFRSCRKLNTKRKNRK